METAKQKKTRLKNLKVANCLKEAMEEMILQEMQAVEEHCGSRTDLAAFDCTVSARTKCIMGSKYPVGPFPTSNVLLLSGSNFSSQSEGISGLNRLLALALSVYPVSIFCAVLQPSNQISDRVIEDCKKLGVTLISLTEDVCSLAPLVDIGELYGEIINKPEKFMHCFTPNNVQVQFAKFTHIVGHSPITANLAIKLKETLFRDAQLILFFNIIPSDLDRLKDDQTPIHKISDEQHLEWAHKADVVYSVAPRNYDYYNCLFKTKSKHLIDHRLFIPICSPETFAFQPSLRAPVDIKILLLAYEYGMVNSFYKWMGLDVGIHAVTTAEKAMHGDPNSKRHLSLTVARISPDSVNQATLKLARFGDPKLMTIQPGFVPDFMQEFRKYCLCLVSRRCEPFGLTGLESMSAGIPTLVSDKTVVGSIIKGLTNNSELFIVEMTQDPKTYRQDAKNWKDRIVNLLGLPGLGLPMAEELKMALKYDERARETNDNFVANIMGGVRLKFRVDRMVFFQESDEENETDRRRRFEAFLVRLMKCCWRLKRHPLEQDTSHDKAGMSVQEGMTLPIDNIICKVFNKIEEECRRVVDIDWDERALVVYCPTNNSLRDLWAMCERINRSLRLIIMNKKCSQVLSFYRLTSAVTRIYIEGPEYLEYGKFLSKCEKERLIYSQMEKQNAC